MKLLITGIVASGKSTLARQLSDRLGIAHYEGDCITWGFPGEERFKRTPDEQRARIDQINENADWIIEGTDRKSQRILYEYADRIIFLDTPLPVRLWRIVGRFVKQCLGLEKSHYKPDLKMLKMMFSWTIDFEKQRKSYETFLRQYDAKLLHIRWPKELNGKL